MLNLYSFRTPSPAAMFLAYRRGVDIIGQGNLYTEIQKRIESHQPGIVVAAWGIHGGERGFRALEVLRAPGKLHVLGWNEDKSPKHPLYLAKSLKPIPVP